jgi:hypothetical protein
VTWNGEAVVMVEEVGLRILTHASCSRQGGVGGGNGTEAQDFADVMVEVRHTTIDMPTHCTNAQKSSSVLTVCHPAARRCTPPEMITTKETSVHNSTATSKEMKKPTVLHMLQKLSSVLQYSLLGNCAYSCWLGTFV